MKRLSLIFLFALGISLTMIAANNSTEINLPKLSFADGNLQKLANLAEQRYKSEEGKYAFEEHPAKWSGKPWQLMMLKYILTVNDILEMTDDNGNKKYDFTNNEAEQVQTAMMKKYFEGRKIAVPADIAGRFNLVQKHVMAFEKDAEFLANGPQYEMNFISGVGVTLRHYLVLRLSREICEKLANTEVQSFVSQEQNLYDYFFTKLSESNGYYLLLTNGYGDHYSMWPLETSGFSQRVLDQRITSLKRMAVALNINGFNVPAPAAGDEAALDKELSSKIRSYLEYIVTEDFGNININMKANTAVKECMEAYSNFMQSRKDLGDYIPNKRYLPLQQETVEYIKLMIEAHSAEM